MTKKKKCGALLTMLALTLTIAPQLSRSETIRVTSGEHADFSRLVFYLTDGTEWNYGINDGVISLYVSSRADFLVERVFDFIPRTRIRSIMQNSTPNGVQISLNCKCRLRVTEVARDIISVDVIDAAADKNNAESIGISTKEFILHQSESDGQLTKRLLSVHFPRLLQSTGECRNVDQSRLPIMCRTVRQEPLTPQQTAFANEDSNSAQMSSSVAIRVALQSNEKEDHHFNSTSTSEPIELEVINDLLAELSSPNSRPLNQQEHQESHKTEDRLSHPYCFDEDLISRFSDIDIHNHEYDLRTLRAGVVDQRGNQDPDAIFELALGLSAHSFGAEAIQLLDSLKTDNRIAQTLRLIAETIDGQRREISSAFLDSGDCKPATQLWVFLALATVDASTALSPDAILDEFLRLPGHLRIALGTEMIGKLDSIGRTDLSLALTASVSNLSQSSPTQPENAISETEPSPTDRSLLRESLAKIENYMRGGSSIPNVAIEDALSFHRETEGTSYYKKLEDIAELKDIYAGEWTSMVEGRTFKGEPDGSEWQELVRAARSQAVTQFSIPSLLQLSLSPSRSEVFGGMLRNDVVLASKRLLAAGFPMAAELVFRELDTGTTPDERRVQAEIALALGDSNKALALLEGLLDQESRMVRAHALGELNKYAQAAQEFYEAGELAEAERLRWLSGQLEQQRTASSSLSSEVVEYTDLLDELELEGSELIETSRSLVRRYQALETEFVTSR